MEKRFKIILVRDIYRIINKGTKYEIVRHERRKYKTRFELMLDPKKLDKILKSQEVFRMACLGFRKVKIIGLTTFASDNRYELQVLEVKE